jgi:hypothetical protein
MKIKVRRWVLFLLILFIYQSCKSVSLEVKNEHREIFEQPDKICGTGLSQLKEFKTKWEAEEAARERARAELARVLKVEIVNTTSDTLGATVEDVEKKFQSKTETYTQTLLENHRISVFYNTPEKGDITAVACIERDEYDKKVRRDLENKKSYVITPFHEGLNALKMCDLSEAFKRFIESKNKLSEFFNGLPLIEEINEKKRDVGGILSARISQILNAVKIKIPDEKFVFSINGEPFKRPSVRVIYLCNREESPMKGISLRADFIKGDGIFSSDEVFTDTNGWAEIPLEWIDTEKSDFEASIKIMFNPERYPVEGLPSARINIYKEVVMGYSVNYFLDGKRIPSSSITNKIKEIMRENNFKSEEFSIDDEEAGRKYSYFLILTGEAKRKNGRCNLSCSAKVVGSIVFYSVLENRYLLKLENISAEGRGKTIDEAMSNAFENMNGIFEKNIRSAVDEIKKMEVKK